MPRDQRTFCRICEAHCGLVVTVDDDEAVVDVRPDREHPVSKGYACVKGTSLGDLHHDPDRLDHPLKRVGEGWERIGWAQAISEIGERVRALRRDHGDRSVALYTGNPTFFSMQQILYSAAFLEALGSPNHFASHSIDVNTKFHVSTEMYGLPTVHPVPDIGRTRFLMILGSNPAVSQMSVIHLPNALRRLQEIEQRGGRVVVVDPRRTETAKKVGEHLAIRPGTDVYLLLAMLHVIVHEDRRDLTWVDQVATGVDDFVAAARPWSPERVEPITGVPAARVRELARAYADADGAALYVSTGINMGPFGSVCYWLVQGLNLITGNLDRAGGLVVPPGPFDALALTKMLGMADMWHHRTLGEGWHRVAGAFPVGALADEITIDHPQRVRALFVSAGNPAHSVPGHQLRDALGELDLLVCIDIYPNETADYADYLLPATDMLERSDYPISWANLQETPYAQWTDAMVAPLHERRQEWEIFSDLAVACGAPALGRSLANTLPRLNGLLGRLPGHRRVTPDHLLALLLRWGRKVSLSDLRDHPEGVPLPATRPGSFLGRRVPTRDGLVHLAPLSILRDLRRVREAVADLDAGSDDTLVLIGRRERRSHNSWMHNNPGINQPAANTALVHPEDAARLLLVDGEPAAVSSPAGSVTLPVEVTDDVSQGVIAVPHGWGHTAALSRAGALGGGNINDVIPGGTLHVEPVSGQSIMLAHRVSVRPAPGSDGGGTAGATAVGGASIS